MLGTQFLWSQKTRKSAQHDHISYLLCGNALNRCIVVASPSLNIHRTRLHGINSVLSSSLLSQVFFELMDQWVVGICDWAIIWIENLLASWLIIIWTSQRRSSNGAKVFLEGGLTGTRKEKLFGISSVSCGVGTVFLEGHS